MLVRSMRVIKVEGGKEKKVGEKRVREDRRLAKLKKSITTDKQRCQKVRN